MLLSKLADLCCKFDVDLAINNPAPIYLLVVWQFVLVPSTILHYIVRSIDILREQQCLSKEIILNYYMHVRSRAC